MQIPVYFHLGDFSQLTSSSLDEIDINTRNEYKHFSFQKFYLLPGALILKAFCPFNHHEQWGNILLYFLSLQT